MTSKKLFATYFIFFIFIYIMYLAFYYPQITTEPVEYPETRQLYDYRGVTHTHSSLSSGSGNIDDIAAAAQAAELDFIYITDLNDFDRSSKNKEGVYGNLLLFVAGEYTYLDSKFLNYHNTTNEHLSSVGRIQLGFSELLEQKNRPLDKGIFVLSHPLKPGYKWDGNIPEGMDGIEVINLKSQWQQWWEASKTSFLFTSLLYPINGRLAFIRLLQRPIKNIRLWDQLNKGDRYTIGFVGNEAEALAKVFKKYPIEVPSYRFMFNVATNHILLKSELTGEFLSDKRKIQSALENGQFYMSYDYLAKPVGFEAYLEKGLEKIVAMGKNANVSAPAELTINLPSNLTAPSKIAIMKDGQVFMTTNSNRVKVDLTVPGDYRIEVQTKVPLPAPDHARWMPWIYTNPFSIR